MSKLQNSVSYPSVYRFSYHFKESYTMQTGKRVNTPCKQQGHDDG